MFLKNDIVNILVAQLDNLKGVLFLRIHIVAVVKTRNPDNIAWNPWKTNLSDFDDSYHYKGNLV